ncbi:MAG: hypothetical protein ACOYM3_22770 [Terrimicrobiaceae bacterium]
MTKSHFFHEAFIGGRRLRDRTLAGGERPVIPCVAPCANGLEAAPASGGPSGDFPSRAAPPADDQPADKDKSFNYAPFDPPPPDALSILVMARNLRIEVSAVCAFLGIFLFSACSAPTARTGKPNRATQADRREAGFANSSQSQSTSKAKTYMSTMHLVSSFTTRDYGADTVRIGDLNGDGAPDLLFAQTLTPAKPGTSEILCRTREIRCLTATTAFGEVLWQHGTPSVGNGCNGGDMPVQVYVREKRR